MPIFAILKKITILSLKGIIYTLILVPGLLFSLVNMIDRYFFGRAMLNQDFYWLMMKTGSEEFIDNTKGHTTPLRKAIRDLNVRAIRALANDPNTNINEVSNEITLLEVAMAAEFESGIKVILEHPEYKLYAKISDLVRIGMVAITKKNKKVFVHILKHIDNSYQLDSHLNVESIEDFYEASELIQEHPKFKPSIENLRGLALIQAIHKKTDNIEQLVKHTDDQELLESILGDCIREQFSEGIGILIDRLFITSNGFGFLLPLLTNENYKIFKDVIESMQPDKKALLHMSYKEKINKMRNTEPSLIKTMHQIRYLKSMHKINYESLAAATGLSSNKFKSLYDSYDVKKHMRNFNGFCPIAQTHTIETPIQLQTTKSHQCGALQWEPNLYQYNAFFDYLNSTIPEGRLQRYKSSTSPISRLHITNIKLAVEEYSEALILAFLEYAIKKKDRVMINNIQKQTDIKLSNQNLKKMNNMIEQHWKRADIDKEASFSAHQGSNTGNDNSHMTKPLNYNF